MNIFPIREEALAHLQAKDPVFGNMIEEIGVIERETTPNLFTSLVFSLVAQQISGKAAETVSKRLLALCEGTITPDSIISLKAEQIQSCGMSHKKAGWIQSAANAFLEGTISSESISQMEDATVIRTLSSLPGIGVWTAEMLLIFSLCRPNVISFGDFGIRKGMMRLYGWKTVSRQRFDRMAKRYAPYGSTASLYLWHIAGMK